MRTLAGQAQTHIGVQAAYTHGAFLAPVSRPASGAEGGCSHWAGTWKWVVKTPSRWAEKGPGGGTNWKLRLQASSACSIILSDSLTNHNFKGKIIKNFTMATTEHQGPSTYPFWGCSPMWLKGRIPMKSAPQHTYNVFCSFLPVGYIAHACVWALLFPSASPRALGQAWVEEVRRSEVIVSLTF